jgi:hypothetical protein
MSWIDDFASLLADCYSDSYDRLADRAGITNLSAINKKRGEIDVWFDIVKLAKREDKLENLAARVKENYSNLNNELEKILGLASKQDAPKHDDYPAEPVAVAQYVVKAIQEHDSERFLRCLPPDGVREMAQLIAERPSFWWVEWQEWVDEIVEIRYEYDRIAYARCGDKDDGYDRYFVIQLTFQNNKWLCSRIQWCTIVSWSKYYLEPPTGPTVLEVLQDLREASNKAREKLERIVETLPDIGNVEPRAVETTLDPPVIVVKDWKSKEISNTCILSYSEACKPGRGYSFEEYNPLHAIDFLHAICWLDPSNHEKTPWIQEKGKWHDPDLRKELEAKLNIRYLIIHRLVFPRIPGMMDKADELGLPVVIEGVIFNFETETAIGSYLATSTAPDSNTLSKLMKQKLLEVIQITTNNSFRYIDR